MTYASERQKEKWNENEAIRNSKLRIEYLTKEELGKRCEKNRQILNDIFSEILEVSEQIRKTTDRTSKAILNNRYRYLLNKYCFCNSIDEVISYK